MAEPKKATSSAVDSKSKEKISVIDEDIGKDFLSSWKMKDDDMDFNFETTTRGNKKAFNFDKVDDDFNLDDDFGKLPSFKRDMPDFDFSSPAKKDAKAKEKPKEETDTGKQQEKKNGLNFSFNFNELDDFDFDSTLNKGEKTRKKNQESKASASEGIGVSKVDQALEDDCITARLPEPRDAANSKAETSKGRAEACDSIDNPCPSKEVPAQGPDPEKLVTAQESRNVPDKSEETNAKETYKSSPPDKDVASELYDQQSLQWSPMDSCSGNNSNPETISDVQAEVCSQGRRKETSSGSEKNVSDKVVINEDSIHEKLHQKNSFPLSENYRDERNGTGGNIQAEIEENQLVQDEKVVKEGSTSSLSTENLDNIAPWKDIQTPAPKLPSVSLDSEPTAAELSAEKDKEAGEIRSRFFRRPEENKSQLHQPSETGKEVSTFIRKKIGDMHLYTTYEKREGSEASEAQSGRKLIDYSKLHSQDLKEGRPVLLKSENNIGRSSDISIHTSVNPNLQVPKIDSVQISKFHSEAHKIAKKASTLSSFKSTRSIGTKVNPLGSQKETSSLRKLERKKDTPGNTSKIVLPAGFPEKQTPKLPSLKRKTFQESNRDRVLLKPLKRISQSPTESRNTESFERVANKEVQDHNNCMEVSIENVLCDHLTSRSEIPREVIMTELGFSSVIEHDKNVEKAEAYGKELDDICNILKKKHEEAKELMVRAIVNNSNLLMLNHPIHKEKISFPFCIILHS
ncbi:HXXXD-type acyl-transferase family protein [Hibiscus syriacus]|uniref:HXXXD-type acyl-transferase family protein n=1 Tax=Hibiscus syriacus TaxID=106335 RepID=A0A6A2YGJ7_HIBSY|nr:HXXXD-type acyl-transferase family protein [Hibiscus syriacus]